MSDNNITLRNVSLNLDMGGIGDLLTEVSRAYLYSGTPSAMLSRVLEGLVRYRLLTSAAEKKDISQRKLAGELEHGLRFLRDKLRALEEQEYSNGAEID